MRYEVGPMDLSRSMELQQLGRFDPTAEGRGDQFRKTFFWRGKLVEARLCYEAGALQVDAPEELPWQLPLVDGYDDFRPSHPLLRRLHSGSALRILGVPWLFDVACSCILQQRVTFGEACGQWRRIVEKWGDAKAFPPAEVIARMAPWQLEQLGVDARRGRTLIALAKEEALTHFLSLATPRDKLIKRLERMVGIGPWTMGMFLGFGLGETDAVITGDVHLPRIVCRALSGDATFSDARMLSLLEPYAGQRFRVVRLLMAHAFGRKP